MNKGCFKDDLSCFGVRFGWQATVLMSPSLAFYFGDKQLGSFHTEGIHRLGDRGKGRVEQRHPRVIVETADRDFAWYGFIQVLQRLQGPDHGRVVSGEYGIGRLRQVKQLQRLRMTLLDRKRRGA